MSTEDTIKQARRKKLLNQILNHQVQGEAFILTDGITWKGNLYKPNMCKIFLGGNTSKFLEKKREGTLS